MTRCKKCGGPIHWIVTKAGKKMPTNPGEVKICTEGGEIVSGFIPHWDTCPYADDFRANVEPNKRSHATDQLHLPLERSEGRSS